MLNDSLFALFLEIHLRLVNRLSIENEPNVSLASKVTLISADTCSVHVAMSLVSASLARRRETHCKKPFSFTL